MVRAFEARRVEGRRHNGECAIVFACVRALMTGVRTLELRLPTRAGETHNGDEAVILLLER